MCGLVGFIGDSGMKPQLMFEDLFQMDIIRGRDSCGVAVVRGKGNPMLFKETYFPTFLLEDPKYIHFMKKMDWECLIGHNRFATRGKVTIKNAHPFRIGNIILAHNGTLDSVHKLPEGHTFDTDSEALCNAVDKIGIKETWANVMGAAAITFYDLEKRTLNIISNGKRPIHWAYTKNKRCVFWASEPEMLRLAAARRGVELDTIYYPPDNTLYSFKFNGREVSHTSEELQPYVGVFPANRENDRLGYWMPFGAYEDECAEQVELFRKDTTSGHKLPVVVSTNTSSSSYTPFDGMSKIDKGKVMKWDKETNQWSEVEATSTPRPKIRTPDPYEAVNVRNKAISKENFEKDYDRCMFCNATLKGDYENSVIIDYDKHIACCSDCADTADACGNHLEGKLY